MNKKRLVELADEVLLDVDYEFQNKAREYFEKRLCKRLGQIFNNAANHMDDDPNAQWYDKNKKSYESVKPVLDDCLNKILGNKNEEK